MPLIIVTGLPCSGKTYRTRQILSELNAHIASNPALSRRTVQIIHSHHSSSDTAFESNISLRDDIYNSASQEKTARAEEFSAIKRALSKDNIVITDGLNYIKGYRYQLWCEAKAAATRCCVVHVAAQEDECKKWNRERLRAWGREDVSDETDPSSSTKQAPGVQGTNVLGDLAPESHTAVYGDRAVEKISRSRSSSLDGNDEDGPDDNRNRNRNPIADDNMTLKSLYIHDKPNGDTSQSGRHPPPIPEGIETPSQTIATTASNVDVVPLPGSKSAPPYSPSTLNSLMMRYEPPSPFSRWDTPLFIIPSFDASPPTTQIWDALYPPPTKATSKKALAESKRSMENTNTQTTTSSGTATGTDSKQQQDQQVKPHAATVLPKATTSDALQVLESATMDVVKHLLASARDAGLTNNNNPTGGGVLASQTLTFSIPIPPTPNQPSPSPSPIEASIYIPSSTTLSQPLLQRLRRKYTQIQRGGIAHGQGFVSGRAAVVEGFVAFLDAEWNRDD